MNSFLLTLGIAVALILSAAFAAPFFIDWSSYRTYFEARAGELIGRPVTFEGDLTVRLVPFPSLKAETVRIGEPGSGEGIERIDMQAALTPLLSGDLQVTGLTLVRPHAVLGLDPAGRVTWTGAGELAAPVDPDRVAIARFDIVEGRFDIDDERSGEIIALTDVNLTGSATSLRGPFKVEGGGVVDGERYSVRLATGRMADDGTGMRVTASIIPAARPLVIEVDGAFLRIEDMPAFDGRLVAERPAEDADTATWRLEGLLTASPEQMVLDQLSVRLGTETQNVSLAGAANVRLGANPRFDAVVSARQVDLDRAFGSGPDEPVSPREAVARLGGLLDPAIFPLPGHLALDVESTVLAGGLMEGLSVDLEVEEAAWTIERATVSAPGRTSLGLAGTVGFTGETPEFDGAARLSTNQATVFANWIFGDRARLPGFAIPAGSLEVSGQMRLDGTGMMFDRGDVKSGKSHIEGSIAYTAPRSGGGADDRGTVAVALTAEELDLSQTKPAKLGDEASVARALEALLTGVDLELDLGIGLLSLADIDARDLSVSGKVSKGDIAIEELVIGDIGGARLSGGGAIRSFAKAPDGDLGLTVTASALDGVIEALRTLGVEAAADLLAARADVLVPADISLDLAAARTDTGSKGDLTLKGTVGGTEINGQFGYDGEMDALGAAAVETSLKLVNVDGGLLARQIGLSPSDLQSGAQPEWGWATLEASGRPNDAVNFRIDSEGIGVHGSVAGSGRLPKQGGREVTGSIDVEIADAESLLALAGIALPAIAPTALQVRGDLSATDDIWRLSSLEVAHGATTVRGDLSVDFGGAEHTLGGKLEIDHVDLAWLLGSLVGAEAVRFPEVVYGEPAWPSTVLARTERPGWRGRIEITAPAFTLFDGVVLTGAETTFTFGETRVSLDSLQGNLFGGRMAAGFDFVDADGVLLFSGRADLANARLEEIVWKENGRAVASGEVSAGIELDGRGRSLAAIVSSLSGTGSFTATNGILRRLNPAAFDQIVSAADAGLDLEEERVCAAFAGHLDSGSLPFKSMEGAFSISSGVLRASTIHIDARDLDSFASATVDLPVLGLDSEWTLQTGADDEDGRKREVGVVFAGPLADPAREIDVNPLLGYLTVRAFEQEVERLERLQSEILERQRLGRELIRKGQERQRKERELLQQEEDAAKAADAAREAEEERARQEKAQREKAEQDAARRQAEEDQRRQAEDLARQREAAEQPLPPETTQTTPSLPQSGSGTAGSIDNSELQRRIETILNDIPSARDGDLSTGGIIVREPLAQPLSPSTQANAPVGTAPAQQPGQRAPPLNAPLVITPQPGPIQPVAPLGGSPQWSYPSSAEPQVSAPQVVEQPPTVQRRVIIQSAPEPLVENPVQPEGRVFK